MSLDRYRAHCSADGFGGLGNQGQGDGRGAPSLCEAGCPNSLLAQRKAPRRPDGPRFPPWGPRGAIVRGKRLLALTAATGTAAAAATGPAAEDAAATGTAAEDAAATGPAAEDNFRGAGLNHGHNTIAESSVTAI
jgi:hypothetical protein